MRNRILSIVLCLALLLTAFPFAVPEVRAAEKGLTVTCDGEEITEISLTQEEKKTLTANAVGLDVFSYSWQILAEAEPELWVDIEDMTEESMDVSLATVKSVFDDAGNAYIRCAVECADGEVFSAPVRVSEEVPTEYVDPPHVTSFEVGLPTLVEEEKPKTFAAMRKAARAGNIQTVTITIQYLDHATMGGTEAAIYTPYTATIEKGGDFEDDITSPTFLGFAPYYDADNPIYGTEYTDDASKVVLDLKNVQEDVVIKVWYKAVKVPFAVKYFFQNINDDLYTEYPSLYFVDEAETGTVIENQYLEDHAGDTTGFSKLYHIPENVAADGSTVFECYYDRNYYLIQFDLNGGYGVDPIYGRYGAPYIVNDPIRHGWVFQGWDLMDVDSDHDGKPDDYDGNINVMPGTIPAANCYYRAVWTTTQTTYKVVYWAQSPDDPDTLIPESLRDTPSAPGATRATLEYLGSKEITGVDSGSVVSGAEYLCGLTAHEHSVDQGCYENCPEKDHVHDIVCYTNQNNYTYVENANLLNNNARTAYNAIVNGEGATAKEGYVYRYKYSNVTSYNFFYINQKWYYLGTNTYRGVDPNGSWGTISNGNYASLPSNRDNCSHSHDNDCLTCDRTLHTHDTGCLPDIDLSRLEYFDADTDVTVLGDGSTVVNVYYRYKEYTFKFYYAATEGVGTDSDADGIPDTYPNTYIIGGDTNLFGHDTGINTDDDVKLLDRNFTNNYSKNRGGIVRLPKLTSDGAAKPYTSGTEYSDETKFTYHYYSFKARYGQNIADLWPVNIFEPVERKGVNKTAVMSAWNGEHHVLYSQQEDNETIKGKYERVDDRILFDPQFGDSEEVSFLLFWENGSEVDNNWNIPELYVYRVWIRTLPGEDLSGYTSDQLKEYNNVQYKLIDQYNTCDNSQVSEQTQPGLQGYEAVAKTGSDFTSSMTAEQKAVYREAWYVDLYYKGRDYTLSFSNRNVPITERTATVTYKTPLASKHFEPEYPKTLEEDAYYFAGWCTTSDCYEGSEFDLLTNSMPSYDLELYAKWSPQTHTVNFYKTYDDMQDKVNVYRTDKVLHGNVVGSVKDPVVEGDGNIPLIFAGWFYMDNGVKKAFTPLDMAVKKDLDVFADWSSHSPQPYKITYVLRNSDTKVADDTTGFAYGGSTRTFVAKAGDPYNQLYPEYNTGYFPTLSSHSITMQYEPNVDEPTVNTHTFEYVHANNIEYTVNYINLETGAPLEEPHIETTNQAVVTVRFKAFENMVPDAFYKRLVIAVEYDEKTGQYVGSESNVINFYYSPNTTKAYYAVHYLTEKLGATDDQLSQYYIDGSGGYEKSNAHIEGIGDVNTNVEITPQTLSGFELIDDDDVARYTIGGGSEKTIDLTGSGKYIIPVDVNGTELYMFYKRKSYNYTVNYYLYNTTEKPIDAPEYNPQSGSMKYGSTLTETAIPIPGFTCVSAQTTQSITIRDKEIQNVINFYYAPVEYVAEYIPVVNGEIPDDVAGWLNQSIEVVDGDDPFKGATPSTSEHYKFDGWYLDEACTAEVGDKATVDSVTNKLTPNKANLSETESNKFYAKFTRLAGDFTITRENAADNKQVFVYQVRNTTTNEELFVTVQGNGSVTIAGLPYGNYAVTQLNGWSWRYGDTMEETEHDGGIGSTVTFSDGASGKWLSGSSNLEHNVKGG